VDPPLPFQKGNEEIEIRRVFEARTSREPDAGIAAQEAQQRERAAGKH